MENLKDKKILIVDDEPEIRIMIERFLRKEGFFRIYTAADCATALSFCHTGKPDIVILDVMLPDGDGFSLLSSIRQFSDMPVLFLSARGEDEDRLLGLGLGADDYIKKPFSKAELEARIRALLRRKKNHDGNSEIRHYTDRVLNINLETQAVELEGKALNLSVTEFSLLACLVRNMGRTVTHSQLLREVWGCEYGNMSTTLTLYIHYLRKKLENSKHDHEYIHTQWGRGYCFVPINQI